MSFSAGIVYKKNPCKLSRPSFCVKHTEQFCPVMSRKSALQKISMFIIYCLYCQSLISSMCLCLFHPEANSCGLQDVKTPVTNSVSVSHCLAGEGCPDRSQSAVWYVQCEQNDDV